MHHKRELAGCRKADLPLCAHLGHSAALTCISEADIGLGRITGPTEAEPHSLRRHGWPDPLGFLTEHAALCLSP